MVGCPLGHIPVIGGEYRTAVVDLGVHDQHGTGVQINNPVGQATEIDLVLICPGPPVVFGICQQPFRSACEDECVQFCVLFVRHCCRYPVIDFCSGTGSQRSTDADG